MKILGISNSIHDAAACVVEHGRVRVAVESERVVRLKHNVREDRFDALLARRQGWRNVLEHDFGPAMEYCLRAANLAPRDLDRCYGTVPYGVARSEGLQGVPVTSVNHHLAHAAAAYFTSGLSGAAILVVDAGGDLLWEGGRCLGAETTTMLEADGREMRVVEKHLGDGVGQLYSLATQALGYGHFGDGKTMGLAPYGTPAMYRDVRAMVKHLDGGRVALTRTVPETLEAFRAILGGARDFQRRADLAMSVQTVFEECMRHSAAWLADATRREHLCISGGVGLNSVSNGKLARSRLFASVYVPPFCHDGGLAIGAALYGTASELSPAGPTSGPPTGSTVYTGRDYSAEAVADAVRGWAGRVEVERPSDVARFTAERLARGEVVCWWQGRSEAGPRALGNRSIVADPRRAEMKDRINQGIKGREAFRPLAPSVLLERAQELFEIDGPAPFMTHVYPVRAEARHLIPAVVHVDGTARVQTVSRADNPRYHALITEFERRTGVPVLLNTSFNLKDEPIVESPEDALRAFLRADVSFLVMDDLVVRKDVSRA